MNQLYRVYLDILSNFLGALFLLRFAETETQKKFPQKNKLVYFAILFLFSLPEEVPYSTFFSYSIDILFLFNFLYPDFKKMVLTFIKYEIFLYALSILLLLIHTWLLNDVNAYQTSPLYQKYKIIILCFLTYVLYVLYINTKKMREFHTHYQMYFNLVIFGISMMLSYVTLYICLENTTNYLLLVIFSTIVLLIILCISLYDKFLSILNENAQYRIQAEVNRLEQKYTEHIEDNLKELHSLRHDIKNHLIIIDGYADQQNYNKIHEYINRIAGNFTKQALIETPSPTVSALLNEKQELSRQQKVNCTITANFPYVNIDDFTIVTILGNLFDNAITAASKCSDGWITANLHQTDSYLEITINNNHKEQIQEKDGIFTSTKKESQNMFHGIGIKNVRRAVEAANGQIDITYSADSFHVYVLVPNYE